MKWTCCVPRPAQELLDALILCDMTVGPRGQRMTVDERIAETLVRYAPDHPVHRAESRHLVCRREAADDSGRVMRRSRRRTPTYTTSGRRQTGPDWTV